MPNRPRPAPKRSPSPPEIELSRLATERADQRSAEFAANLREMAAKFMVRRGSRTLDATDIESAHTWLTRPPRKAAVRDAIASIAVFLAAGMMAYGINNLSAPQPVKGGWFTVTVSLMFGLLAEVFRRWEYD